MTFDPVEHLQGRFHRFFVEAVHYYSVMSCVNEDEPWHAVLANEFRAALALVPTIIKNETFVDLRSLEAVYTSLDRFHHAVRESLPMTALQLEQLLREIKIVCRWGGERGSF